MKIAVLGGGFTGLTAALRLVKQGHKVTVFEKENKLGGLAGGFKENNWDWTLEYHYHHLFTSDHFARNLLCEIGKEDLLIFKRPETAIFFDDLESRTKNQEIIHKFDSPVDLLKFSHLSFWEKIRTGFSMAYLKFNPFGINLEKITAYEWLPKYMGQRPFEVLWKPLFEGKFGKEASSISMAWFWARIFKRSSSLGYVKGGFQKMADLTGGEIIKLGGDIITGTGIEKIQNQNGKIDIIFNSEEKSETVTFDKVICTLPTEIFLKLALDLPADYRRSLLKLKHLDALNFVMYSDKPFFSKKTYWLNINMPGFPFLAVVEHTNFIEKSHYNNSHIIYVGNYLPKGHEYFHKTKEELLEIFTPFLQKFNPDFQKHITGCRIFHGHEAQPVIPINYSALKPDFKTPWENLILANMDMVYPWDRGTNYAIELGEKAAAMITD